MKKSLGKTFHSSSTRCEGRVWRYLRFPTIRTSAVVILILTSSMSSFAPPPLPGSEIAEIQSKFEKLEPGSPEVEAVYRDLLRTMQTLYDISNYPEWRLEVIEKTLSRMVDKLEQHRPSYQVRKELFKFFERLCRAPDEVTQVGSRFNPAPMTDRFRQKFIALHGAAYPAHLRLASNVDEYMVPLTRYLDGGYAITGRSNELAKKLLYTEDGKQTLFEAKFGLSPVLMYHWIAHRNADATGPSYGSVKSLMRTLEQFSPGFPKRTIKVPPDPRVAERVREWMDKTVARLEHELSFPEVSFLTELDRDAARRNYLKKIRSYRRRLVSAMREADPSYRPSFASRLFAACRAAAAAVGARARSE